MRASERPSLPASKFAGPPRIAYWIILIYTYLLRRFACTSSPEADGYGLRQEHFRQFFSSFGR